ncbi:MAG: hypothetical protein FWH22_10780 [Fibromonadales bacterium]|nr:hypothetical protein [Fibromonadales bacterium]
MLKFRNIDVSPSDPVEKWGVEGILCAFERGSIDDWRKIWKSVYVDKSEIVAENVQEVTQMLSKGDLGYAISKAFF